MTTEESSVYCYLQIKMHKFRILLLIPFMVSLCLSYFSQHAPLDNSKSFKNAPLISSLQSTSLEALQFAKVKQFSKAAPTGSPGPDALVHDSTHSPEPVRIIVGKRYLLSHSGSSFQQPALFPNRASPV